MYMKSHLTPLEQAMGLTPGNQIQIFETQNVKVGIALCYEIEFPELVRILTLQGAEIIFCPSHTLDEFGFWRVRHCCQARAIENHIYVVHCCLVGIPPNPVTAGWGKSSILSPCEKPWPSNGTLVESEVNEETVITSKLDLKLLRKKRTRGATTPLTDRRPELYTQFSKKHKL